MAQNTEKLIEFNNEHFKHDFETKSYNGTWSYRFHLNKVVNESDKVILYGDYYQAANLGGGETDVLPFLNDINEESPIILDEDDYNKLYDEVDGLCACFKLGVVVIYDRNKLENIFNKKQIEIVDALIKEDYVSEPAVWFGYDTRDENLGSDELYAKLKNRPKELVDYIKEYCTDVINDTYRYDEYDMLYTKPSDETITFKF